MSRPIRVLALAAACLTTSPAHAQSVHDRARALLANAVRVEAEGRTGFGFVVGLTPDGRLLVATAWHTLEGLFDPKADVCFHPGGDRCARGETVYVADAMGSEPALDVAVLAVPYPAGLAWRADALGTPPEPGQEVLVIGRARQWYVPGTPGKVVRTDPGTRTVVYEELEVTEGVSGAPVLAADGIVALHLRSAGAEIESEGTAIEAIRRRVVEQVGGRWILVPPPACDDQEAQRRALEGEAVDVHMDAARPGAAVEAMALLACLGAQVRPALHPPDDAWPGNGIAYASGGLRQARALQSALSFAGRLDTSLVEDAASLQVWIR